MKTFVAAAAALLIAAGGLSAAETKEVKGKVKKVDADASKVVVVVDGKDVEYAVEKDAKITQAPVGKKKKTTADTASELTGGLKSVKDDAQVTLTVESRDGRDVVKSLKVEAAETAKKKKKDK